MSERQDAERRLNEAIARSFGWKFGNCEEHGKPEYRNSYLGDCWWFEGAPYSADELPEYATDESASALLLEAMPSPELQRQYRGDSKSQGQIWRATADNISFKYGWSKDPDRKLAIRAAYCKFKGGECLRLWEEMQSPERIAK